MAENKPNPSGFKTTQTDIDPETGTISWDITYKPDYALMYKAFNTVWNAFRTHVRTSHPAEYKKLKAIDE